MSYGKRLNEFPDVLYEPFANVTPLLTNLDDIRNVLADLYQEVAQLKEHIAYQQDLLEMKVDIDGVKSAISISPEDIKISASKLVQITARDIVLSGNVTFKDLLNDTETKIIGNSIDTGTLTANDCIQTSPNPNEGIKIADAGIVGYKTGAGNTSVLDGASFVLAAQDVDIPGFGVLQAGGLFLGDVTNLNGYFYCNAQNGFCVIKGRDASGGILLDAQDKLIAILDNNDNYSMLFGYGDAFGLPDLKGLLIDGNNYWLNTGEFRVGSASNYLHWDGNADLVLKGDNGSIEIDTNNKLISIDNGSMLFGYGDKYGLPNLKGLLIDGNNYWLNTGEFRVGNTSSYIHWDAANATLEVHGKVIADEYSTFAGNVTGTVNGTPASDVSDATGRALSDLTYNHYFAGRIRLDKMITASDPATGVVIDANGIRAYHSGELTFELKQADGSAYFKGDGHFGDDNTYVDLTGVSASSFVSFYVNGYKAGYIFSDSFGNLAIRGTEGLFLYAGQLVGVSNGKPFYANDIYPNSSDSYACGTTSSYWQVMAAHVVYYKNAYAFSHYDVSLFHNKTAKDIIFAIQVDETGHFVVEKLPPWMRKEVFIELPKDKKSIIKKTLVWPRIRKVGETEDKVTYKSYAIESDMLVSLLVQAIKELYQEVEEIKCEKNKQHSKNVF